MVLGKVTSKSRESTELHTRGMGDRKIRIGIEIGRICHPARDSAGMYQSSNCVDDGGNAREDERPCADHKLDSTFEKR
jgi:hypothetical protein